MTATQRSGKNTDNIGKELFVFDEKTYGSEYRKHLLEQYKICVETADKISSRRSAANNFFLSINTLLFTAIGLLSRLGSGFTTFTFVWVVVASAAGILFCWTWLSTIQCYRKLNSAKFEVINKIEQKLPVKAFETEWAILTADDMTEKYPQLTQVERWVPKIFTLLYLVLALIAIISTVCQLW